MLDSCVLRSSCAIMRRLMRTGGDAGQCMDARDWCCREAACDDASGVEGHVNQLAVPGAAPALTCIFTCGESEG